MSIYNHSVGLCNLLTCVFLGECGFAVVCCGCGGVQRSRRGFAGGRHHPRIGTSGACVVWSKPFATIVEVGILMNFRFEVLSVGCVLLTPPMHRNAGAFAFVVLMLCKVGLHFLHVMVFHFDPKSVLNSDGFRQLFGNDLFGPKPLQASREERGGGKKAGARGVGPEGWRPEGFCALDEPSSPPLPPPRMPRRGRGPSSPRVPGSEGRALGERGGGGGGAAAPLPGNVNIVRVCVKASPAEGGRRLHTNTAFAHLWGFSWICVRCDRHFS